MRYKNTRTLIVWDLSTSINLIESRSMGRGKRLTTEEIGQIRVYQDPGKTIRFLARPDECSCYFHDLKMEEIYLEKQHSKGGGVMEWGAITYYGTVALYFQSSKMTAIN